LLDPSGAVLVEDEGPPVVLRMLQDRTREQIRPSPPLRRRSAPQGEASSR